MKKGLISKLLTALLVVGLLFSILPSQQAQAAAEVTDQAGLTAALAGTETDIMLMADISIPGFLDASVFTVPAGRTVTLDLNGKTISADVHWGGIFSNAGTLTIVDNSAAKGGKIINTNTTASPTYNVPKSAISNTGVLTVNEGVTVAGPAQGHGAWNSPPVFNPAYGIDNLGGGQVTVNGATISGANGLRNFANGANTSITINGGTITGRTGISMQSFGTVVGSLIINGNPTVTGATGSAIYARGVTQYNQIVINGGTFTGNHSDGTLVVGYGTLEINGGNFIDNIGEFSLYNWYANATVTGGTFNGNVHGGVTDSDGNGLTTFAHPEGTKIYVRGAISGNVSGREQVTVIHSVVNGGSIQAAINAAYAGDIIEVAAGTYVENLTVNKKITLTGAGMDLTTVVGTNGNATNFTFATDGATVQGFHFTHVYTEAELTAWNFNNNGVTFNQGATGNTLKDSKVTLGRNGIYLNNTTGNILQGNLVENNRTGINLTNTVDGTKLLNNTIKDNWTLGIVYYSQGQMTDFSTLTISGNSFIDNWYSEILIKDAQVSTGTLNVTGNSFSDNPVTMTNNADAKWNEPGYGALKPVALGGSATMPTTPWPTLRIYNSTNVTLVHDNQVLVEFASLQEAIDLAAPGATIMVAPGTYNEDLTINKAITLQGPGFVETFDNAIDLTEWYVDRKAPGVFESGTFQGENVLHHGIRAVDHNPDNSSVNHQGRKIDINTSGPNQIVSIDLFVGEDWNIEDRGAGMWATGFDAANGVSAYPIVAFRHSATEPAGFYAFNYIDGGWILLRAAKASDYGRWHTMDFELIAGVGVKHYIDGEMLLSFADPDTRSIGNVILNASNFAEDYDVYWDNFGAHDARINGEINISAGNVNLNGLMLSNPGDTQAVVIHSTANGVNLSENLILEVGGKEFNQKVQGVYLQSGPDQVKFENNLFTRIHASDKSANGIFSGDTVSTDASEGLIIKNNRFVSITSGTKGAYGILLNNAAGNPGALIEGNLFSAVAGGWTHAIGMEGPTPNAKIEKNIFNELTYGDAHAAIFFEANPGYVTTQIISNQFLSKDYFSVAVHEDMGEVELINVEKNWWGKTAGPEFPLQLNDPAKFIFYPWCLDAACTSFNAIPEVGFEMTEVAGVCSAEEKTIEIKATDLVNLSAYRMAFDYDQDLVEIVKVENISGLAGIVKTNTNDTTDGKYVFEFYRNAGDPISGESGLIKITYKSKQLAGDAEFTLDAANSMLVQWPNVNPIPFTVSNATTKVTYPLVATNTTQSIGYCRLDTAIFAAASGDTVRAEVNAAIPPQVIEKELTLNTNGMTISRDPAHTVGNNFFMVQNGGKLTLTGAGTISTTKHTAILVQGSLGSETVLTNNDVNIIGPYFSVAVNANRTPGGTDIYPAKYIMLGGKTQDSVIAQGKGAELDLRGGKMYGVPPVMGNGTVDADYDNSGTIIRVSGTVEIFGSTINPNASGIYHPQYGDLYISGGTIEGYNGVEMKAGNLTMTGGNIQGVGAYVESPDYTGNGSTKAGDGLFVYSRNGYSTNNLININISGGEISSTNAYAIREFNHSGEANRIDKFSISGGTFLGNTGLDAVLFTVADPDHDKLALTAGAYSSNPAIYVYSPLATYLDTDNLYRITTQPTITADPFAAYYLTVDENAFKATLTNPAGAASYAHAMVKLTIPGATLADLPKIQFIEPVGLASITWKQVGDDLVGWYGGVAIGGVPLPAGASVDRDITIKFNEAGIYTLKGELYQMDGTIVTDGDYSGHAISKLTEASFSVTVYDKPVITTDLVGPYHAGEAANVTINVNDVDAIFTPDKTELHLDLPEGTIVVYNGSTYTCTATGCVIPVTLAEGNNALAVTITFPGAFEGKLTIGLFDEVVIPGKQLATFETPAVVSVYGNVASFTGTVSMQGQLTNRKNVPMTLTAPVGFGFGPYNATSDSRGKLTFTNLPVGSYFVTTNQARYLNLYLGAGVNEQWVIDLSTLTSLPELWLRGGNAVWTNNIIDLNDANRVGSDWGATVTADTDGDVNFDGIVNIQDIALVGGNFDLTSATAYADWLN